MGKKYNAYLASDLPIELLDMSNGYAVLFIEQMSIDQWALLVNGARIDGRLKCLLEHKPLIMLAERLLEMDEYAWGNDNPNIQLECKQQKLEKIKNGDVIYLLKPRLSLNASDSLNYNKIMQLLREDKIAFYAVHYDIKIKR